MYVYSKFASLTAIGILLLAALLSRAQGHQFPQPSRWKTDAARLNQQPQKPGPAARPGAEKRGIEAGKEVEGVTLYVTVADKRHHPVTDLSSDNFVIYEDDQLQQITSFRREDTPVSIGIVVDNSGSMREKRAAITKPVMNFVNTSNPQDEVFIVNFNDESYLDQDFTRDVNLIREALDRLDSRGSTALYDSVIASAEHMAKTARHEKKALLVFTDGVDNASRGSLEQCLRAVQNTDAPAIYAIGIFGNEGGQRRVRRALEQLSVQTGGVVFFPTNLNQLDEMSQEVARDIRNQYGITYKPSNPKVTGGYRRVKVIVRAPGYNDLQVRARRGYFAG